MAARIGRPSEAVEAMKSQWRHRLLSQSVVRRRRLSHLDGCHGLKDRHVSDLGHQNSPKLFVVLS
jgi:hypothetical protein